VPDYSGADWVAEVADTAARLMLAGRQMRERKRAGGDALSAFGRKSVQNANEGGRHLPRSQKTGLGVEKRVDSTVREDIMSVKATERPTRVAGRRSYGKCRVRSRPAINGD